MSNQYGIFEERINPLIQALARARNPESEIYIILPIPKGSISDNYNHKANGLTFRRRYEYFSITEQKEILKYRYEKKIDEHSKEIGILKNLNNDLKLLYDSFEWYRLTYGDKVLYSNIEIYGKDFPAYVYWAAINNQFVNTRLRKIFLKDEIIFEGDKFIPDILKFINGHCTKNCVSIKFCLG